MQLDLDQAIHPQVDQLRTDADVDVPDDVRRYYEGDQDPMATPEQREALGDRAQRDFVENVLARCVNTIASRLLFRRYLCESDDVVQTALAEFAIKNHMTNQVVVNTVRCLVDGNNAMSLSWESDERRGGRVVVHQEPWWDGEEGMFVSVDTEGIAEWAVKEWTDLQGRKRRTVYTPNLILRYIQETGGWRPYPDEEQAVQAWLKRDGTPLGVPVVHFGNSVTSDTQYGVSAIVNLLSLQDALNGTIFDIVAAGALSAFPLYWATGVDPNSDRLHIGPGRVWKTGSPNAAFGQLEGGSMTALLDSYKAIRSAIANQFPVAEHLVTGGDWPSGLALTKVESPMIGMVKLLGDALAPAYVLLAHRNVEIANAFGEADLDEDAMIRIEYAPAEQLDEGTTTEIDREKVGLYKDLESLSKPLMLKTGLVTEAEADQIISDRDRRAAAVYAALDTGAFGEQDYGVGSAS